MRWVVVEAHLRGIYEAYAWQQGYEGKAVKFRVPSTMGLMTDEGKWQEVPFDVADFMRVVAEVDDGGIHYWRWEVEATVSEDALMLPPDGFLTLACTEDASMDDMPEDEAANYHTAHEEDYWEEVVTPEA